MAAMESKRTYNITVFGATGYTGKYVVEDLKNRKVKDLTWAVAGRDETKLKAVLDELECADVPVIVSDVNDPSSLEAMCSQSDIIISCVGPFQLYGEPLVKACIASKCNYIDVTGETYFMELMKQKYHQAAEEAGVYLVSACGFDSIPNDIGVLFTKERFQGDLQYIESYLKMEQHDNQKFVFNTGTWDSLVNGLHSYSKVKELRRNVPKLQNAPQTVKAPSRNALFYSKEMNRWCLPFAGCDRSIVARTQRFLFEQYGETPLNFKPYWCQHSFWSCIGLAFSFTLLALLAQFSFGRKLLTNYPSFFSGGTFSKNGPTRQSLENRTFSVTLYGYGFKKGTSEEERKKPNSTIVTRVRGPDPGYVGTSHLLVEAALTVLNEASSLPQKGGVLTPGSAFAKTNLIKRLNDGGKVVFEVVEEQK